MALKVASLVDGMVGRLLNSVHHRLQLVFLAGIQSQIPSAVDTCGQDTSAASRRILTYLCWVCSAVCFISAGKSPATQRKEKKRKTHTCKCNAMQPGQKGDLSYCCRRTCIEIGWQAARVVGRKKQVDEDVVCLLRRQGFERWVMILA